MNTPPTLAFTIKGQGHLRAIITDIGITTPFLGLPSEQLKSIVVRGLWDTGATNTVITKKVVDALGIAPIGKASVGTANGETVQNIYLVNVILPNNLTVQSVRVTEGNLKDIDALIGMDIINLGDFSITNLNKKTTFTFRYPSCNEIDYVEEFNQNNLKH